MTTPAKKFRSKWVRIFCEGATTDGRTIERAWIEQMAASYDPNTYGARLNCEHIRGLGGQRVRRLWRRAGPKGGRGRHCWREETRPVRPDRADRQPHRAE